MKKTIINKKINHSKIFFIISCVCSIIYGAKAHASDCQALVSGAVINVGTIIVQRDVAIGAVLTGEIYGPEQAVYDCSETGSGDSGFNSGYEAVLPQVAVSGANAVLATNVPGIGIQLGVEGGFSPGQWNFYLPAGKSQISQGASGGTTVRKYTYKPKLIFVRTPGSVSSGLLTGQIGAFITSDNANGVSNNTSPWGPQVPIMFGTGTITVVACAITTPNLSFPIGDVTVNSFGSVAGFINSKTSTANLGLNCDPNANINVALSGTLNPDASNASVLALNNQGSAGTASGVGVQLLYNGTPLVLNNRIVLKQSAGGQETFPITARYYQTKTTVTTGDASASATLTLTYQ